jgi:sugar phosphate isomerase/epimerase
MPSAGESGLRLSLAAWSMHRMFFAGEVDQLGMVALTAELGFSGLELVNTFFPSPQYSYIKKLRSAASEAGIEIPLIMCDGEGDMASPDAGERRVAVRMHRKWLEVGSLLGCHSIRANARGGGEDEPEPALERAAESFSALCDYAAELGLNVLIENHWGLSSQPDWLMELQRRVGRSNFGTLPDFGNFPPEVDRYDAIEKMLPRARAVSAKCYDFDEHGNERRIDFPRILDLVKHSGYQGYVGVEYEGKVLGEREGIIACRGLLERLI